LPTKSGRADLEHFAFAASSNAALDALPLLLFCKIRLVKNLRAFECANLIFDPQMCRIEHNQYGHLAHDLSATYFATPLSASIPDFDDTRER